MISKRVISLGLSIVGVVGVGVTSWLSIRGHEKAKLAEDRKGKLYCYAPAIASGVATAGCILGSHHVSSKEIAALTASCGYLAANRNKILEKVKAAVGEDKAKEISKEAALETARAHKTKPAIEETGYGNVHFVEDMFGKEFYCSLEHVEWAEKMLNHLYSHGERTNYNTFYELLGCKKTRAGWGYGWPGDESFYDSASFGYSTDEPILFENTKVEDEDGNVCYVISVRMTPPVEGYLELE